MKTKKIIMIIVALTLIVLSGCGKNRSNQSFNLNFEIVYSNDCYQRKNVTDVSATLNSSKESQFFGDVYIYNYSQFTLDKFNKFEAGEFRQIRSLKKIENYVITKIARTTPERLENSTESIFLEFEIIILDRDLNLINKFIIDESNSIFTTLSFDSQHLIRKYLDEWVLYVIESNWINNELLVIEYNLNRGKKRRITTISESESIDVLSLSFTLDESPKIIMATNFWTRYHSEYIEITSIDLDTAEVAMIFETENFRVPRIEQHENKMLVFEGDFISQNDKNAVYILDLITGEIDLMFISGYQFNRPKLINDGRILITTTYFQDYDTFLTENALFKFYDTMSGDVIFDYDISFVNLVDKETIRSTRIFHIEDNMYGIRVMIHFQEYKLQHITELSRIEYVIFEIVELDL